MLGRRAYCPQQRPAHDISADHRLADCAGRAVWFGQLFLPQTAPGDWDSDRGTGGTLPLLLSLLAFSAAAAAPADVVVIFAVDSPPSTRYLYRRVVVPIRVRANTEPRTARKHATCKLRASTLTPAICDGG